MRVNGGKLRNLIKKVQEFFLAPRCKECGKLKEDCAYIHNSICYEPTYVCTNNKCKKMYLMGSEQEVKVNWSKEELKEICLQYPNDSDLGAELREIIQWN